jgi:hypothetical protein
MAFGLIIRVTCTDTVVRRRQAERSRLIPGRIIDLS